jgi:hypothetical protein
MKKAYRPKKKKSNRGVAQLGAVLVIVAGLAVLAVAAFALWGNGASSAGPDFTPEVKGAPRLRADKQKVDLGNVTLGQTVQVSFEITNTGDQPLRFDKDPFVEVVQGC